VDLPNHQVMSFAELTRRLGEVRLGEAHLKTQLPPDSDWNRTLRLKDIIAYTGIPYPWLLRQFPEMPRLKSIRDRERKGGDSPVDKHEIEQRQRELSRFFYGWDAGTLIKARIRDEWKIVGRYQDAESLGAPPRPQAHAGKVIAMRIDPESLGLKFR
jgi:hypothetical protein